jgi:predicted nucleotidyltransferase
MASAAANPIRASADLFLVTPEKVLDVVETIIANARPLQITAFGSRARGTHRPESDFDLAVMLEEYEPGRRPPPISRSDLNPWMPIDLLVFNRARHEFMKDSIISVHHDIEKEGVTLYDAGTGSIDYRAIARIAG